MAEIPASLGEYVLLESLSESRTGTIHKAKHRSMGRVVAVKILSAQASRVPGFVKRFERKMKILAGLSHPNLAAAYEGGQHGETYYLVMEYVDGQNLASLVKSRGPLRVGAAVEYALQAAAALGYAHDQGVYHRNVRPDHLMIDRQGVVKVVGFGLAHVDAGSLFSDEEPGAVLTREGLTIGTPEYMAPEQAANAAEVDQRADVYSLGCTLYALLTGKPPYPSKSLVQQIAAHGASPIPSLRAVRPDAPPALDSVLQKMMAKRADDRYASMAEVAAALEACSDPGRSQRGSAGENRAHLPAGNRTFPLAPMEHRHGPPPADGGRCRDTDRAGAGCRAGDSHPRAGPIGTRDHRAGAESERIDPVAAARPAAEGRHVRAVRGQRRGAAATGVHSALGRPTESERLAGRSDFRRRPAAGTTGETEGPAEQASAIPRHREADRADCAVQTIHLHRGRGRAGVGQDCGTRGPLCSSA